jgi:hypothetical protein
MDYRNLREMAEQPEQPDRETFHQPSSAPSLHPGEVSMYQGRNQFGRPQWTWHVFKNGEGRFLCPYCNYKSFRLMQLKYHFLAQHIWLLEITEVDVHEASSSSLSSLSLSEEEKV